LTLRHLTLLQRNLLQTKLLQITVGRRRTNRISVPITYTSQEQVEVYRFSVPAAIVIPLVALFLQAFVPLRMHFFSIFDLPLLVVIFFAVGTPKPGCGAAYRILMACCRIRSLISRSGFLGSPRQWWDLARHRWAGN